MNRVHYKAQRNTAKERIIDMQVAKLTQPLFAVTPTMTGYEVIDTRTGHPMGFARDTPASANGVASRLNQAAAAGPKFLARALKAGYDD